MDRYVRKYAESTPKKSKKEILESVKTRLSKVKESLKKFKEDEAKELEKAVDEISDVVSTIIDTVGIESPAVDTLVDAGQAICAQAEIADLVQEKIKK